MDIHISIMDPYALMNISTSAIDIIDWIMDVHG